jgi:hypothetical protein
VFVGLVLGVLVNEGVINGVLATRNRPIPASR